LQQVTCDRWVCVGVEQEWGTPVLHLSLITPLRQCSPSRHVSYLAPQLSVTAGSRNPGWHTGIKDGKVQTHREAQIASKEF
jgi:hypothetical protein